MKPYPLVITPTDNGGYIVQVGCKMLVFADTPSMIGELQRYLLSPEAVGNEYAEKHQWGPLVPPSSAMPLGAPLGALGRPIGGPYYTGRAGGGGGGMGGGLYDQPSAPADIAPDQVSAEAYRGETESTERSR